MTTDSRPNVLFIVVDDCGYADLSCCGQTDYATPALDRLASEGVRFTQAYANAPLCTNTRVAIMTGQYQYRFPLGLVEPLLPAQRSQDGMGPAAPLSDHAEADAAGGIPHRPDRQVAPGLFAALWTASKRV
jgi:arylsulfatase A-like enzyme